MRGVKQGVLGLIFLVLLTAPVVSLGLSYEFLENRTLVLPPGGNYYFKLIIQNEENQDITVNVSMESDIAKIIGGGVVDVPANSYDNFVYFNVSIPEDDPIYKTYEIPYTVTPAPSENGGQVPFAVKYDRTLKVLVFDPGRTSQATPPDVEEVLAPPQGIDPVVIALLLVIIVLLLAIAWKIYKK